jgi:hypothetical protein
MEAIKFKMDTRALLQWLVAWKQVSREAGKWAAKMVNDMAFEFKRPPGVHTIHEGWIRFQSIFLGWCTAKNMYKR